MRGNALVPRFVSRKMMENRKLLKYRKFVRSRNCVNFVSTNYRYNCPSDVTEAEFENWHDGTTKDR